MLAGQAGEETVYACTSCYSTAVLEEDVSVLESTKVSSTNDANTPLKNESKISDVTQSPSLSSIGMCHIVMCCNRRMPVILLRFRACLQDQQHHSIRMLIVRAMTSLMPVTKKAILRSLVIRAKVLSK